MIIFSLLLSIVLLGLAVGSTVYFAGNSTMGRDCSEPLYLNYIQLSILIQVIPLFLTLERILQLLPFKITILKGSTFQSFWLTMYMQTIGFNGLIDLLINLAFPKICGPEIKSNGLFVVFWIITGFMLLLTLWTFFLDIGYVVTYFRNRQQFFQEFNLGPWIDRKRRAVLLQQLKVFAGTKEGCKLLVTEYCEKLCNWVNIFTHEIVVIYFLQHMSERVMSSLCPASNIPCETCIELIKPRDLYICDQQRVPRYHHLNCAQKFDPTTWDRLFPKPKEYFSKREAKFNEVVHTN